MTKKTIVHIIDGLGRGGAETVFVGMLADLDKLYDIVLVVLSPECHFSEEEVVCYKKYIVPFTSIFQLPNAILKVKKIIKAHQPMLVRTDLFWSTAIGRFATPKSIPFIFGVHSILSKDSFSHSKILRQLERSSYKKRHTLIAVANAVIDDYTACVGAKGEMHVLHNYINQLFFEQPYSYEAQDNNVLKLVAVGNLKSAKNFEFLLEAIAVIHSMVPVTLDIIGEGHLREKLQAMIDEKKLPVVLVGRKSNVHELLPKYNGYIMCSHYEGFGNAAVEAMAIGLPLILNETDTMKEMSNGNALFFEQDNVQALAETLCSLPAKRQLLQSMSEKGKHIARELYTKESYLKKLAAIYTAATAKAIA